MLQHLVNAAPRFDGACNGKLGILLDKQLVWAPVIGQAAPEPLRIGKR